MAGQPRGEGPAAPAVHRPAGGADRVGERQALAAGQPSSRGPAETSSL